MRLLTTRNVAFAAVACVAAVIVLFLAARYLESGFAPAADHGSTSVAGPASDQPGFIYGRITDGDGDVYEGRLRWGGDEEAFWGDYFDGEKDANPWAGHAPQPPAQRGIEIFGLKFGGADGAMNLDRRFMVRFGDIARVEAHVGEVQVTLKSGTRFVLNRFEAGDIDDGVRVWDRTRGVIDLDARRIRTIEFLPAQPLVAAPRRLHGTVRTRQGEFTGFLQWDRQDCVGTDTLDGRVGGEDRRVPYDSIRVIARRSSDSAQVTLVDGSQMTLSGSREAGRGFRGVYVDDARYGRVLISWDAFERVEFSAAGTGPAYGDFVPGRPLMASVTTRDGRHLAGRLVYDFDESETTETLDAPSQNVDYNIPFALINSITAGRDGKRPRVTLQSGDELELEANGDLGPGNAGLLVFTDGQERPEYVAWTDVAQIDFGAASAAKWPVQ